MSCDANICKYSHSEASSPSHCFFIFLYVSSEFPIFYISLTISYRENVPSLRFHGIFHMAAMDGMASSISISLRMAVRRARNPLWRLTCQAFVAACDSGRALSSAKRHGLARHHHLVIWCILVHSGAFWCILVHSGAFWCILVHSGAFWCILVHSGAFWCILVHSGAFWCILVHSGAFWCPLFMTTEL